MPYDKRHLDLLYEFASKKLTLRIPEMILRDANGDVVGHGLGLFAMEEDLHNIELRIEQLDFSPMELMRRQSGGRAFAYTKDEHKLFAEGNIESGLKFKTSPLEIGTISYSLGNGSSSGAQVLTPERVDFSSNEIQGDFVRVLLTSQKGNFLPSNVNRDVSESFRLNLPYPYGRIELSSGEFEAGGREDHHYLLTRTPQPDDEATEATERSLLLALSYCSGTKIHKRATFEAGLRNITSLYRTTTTTGSTLFDPLHYVNDASGYDMIPKIQALLRQPGNKAIEDLLEVYLISPTPFESGSRTLHVCVLLEGLFGELLNRCNPPKNENFEKSRNAVVGAIEGGLTGAESHFISRFAGIIKSMSAMSLKEQFEFLSREYKVPVEDTEQVFFKLRPRFAHGRFENPYTVPLSQAQDSLDNLGYITNLFNKFLLRLAGYEGKYFDYSIPGGRHSKFSEQIPPSPARTS